MPRPTDTDLCANDPFSALKPTLKAEINGEPWVTFGNDTMTLMPMTVG